MRGLELGILVALVLVFSIWFVYSKELNIGSKVKTTFYFGVLLGVLIYFIRLN